MLRRVLLAAVLLVSFGQTPGDVHAAESLPEPEVGDGGTHIQPWFKDSFLELAEDLQETSDAGKRLVVFWEQKGCPSCRRMHETNLRNRQIVDYIKKHFDVVQLNTKGVREVKGFDGKSMTERKFGDKTILMGTPTIQFFVKDPKTAEGKSSRRATAWRFTGYIPRQEFLNAFVYVQTGAYKKNPDFISWYRNSGDTVKLEE